MRTSSTRQPLGDDALLTARECPAWSEVVLDRERAAELPSAAAVAHGCSVVQVHALASASECRSLCAAASAAAQRVRRADCLIGLVRAPIVDLFDSQSDIDACEALLQRCVRFVQAQLPSLAKALFGEVSFETVLRNSDLVFSPGEPALNVYTQGGCFTPHEDEQSLTCLLNLSDAGSYDGGGTAFWSSKEGLAVATPPSVVLRTPAGTALLFGGTVTHAGQPIRRGERCVLVASFSTAGHDCFVPHGEALVDAREPRTEECSLDALCAALAL